MNFPVMLAEQYSLQSRLWLPSWKTCSFFKNQCIFAYIVFGVCESPFSSHQLLFKQLLVSVCNEHIHLQQ